MRLDVTEATMNPGQEYRFSERQAMAPVEMSGTTVTFDDVAVTGIFQALDDGSVTVEGTLITTAHAPCANCLSNASSKVEASFRETFNHGIVEDDDENFYYEGHVVDLDKLLMTYTVLSLPLRFLCREDCRGLGAYLADDERVHLRRDDEEINTQHPFAALQQLLDEKSGEAE